ncbi:MAG: hypothetical protein QW828_08400, partial [Candidatus Bathyarchaeia archaeon]
CHEWSPRKITDPNISIGSAINGSCTPEFIKSLNARMKDRPITSVRQEANTSSANQTSGDRSHRTPRPDLVHKT